MYKKTGTKKTMGGRKFLFSFGRKYCDTKMENNMIENCRKLVMEKNKNMSLCGLRCIVPYSLLYLEFIRI